MIKDFVNNIAGLFENNNIFVFYSIIILIFQTMETLLNKYLQAKDKGTLRYIIKIISVLLPLVLLIVSFVYLSGWKFWVSQAVGWLAIFNIFVFRKMYRMLKSMPKLK
ncbi:MAG: hypothetical protein L3J56_04255 [Bacteroidales bacterium]|nr:hypothetical protein [Bacteroidales bacterium]